MKKTLIVAATLASLLAACSSTPTDVPVENRTPGTAQPGSDIKTPVTPVAINADPFKGLTALDKNPQLQKRSVYFEYDSYSVSQEYVSVLEAHSKFLKTNPDVKVLIQGNTDERGSREYNLALGQKRAEAIYSNLKLLGVQDMQLEAVSLGEEKPKATSHDEAAWAENRRGDLVYSGK